MHIGHHVFDGAQLVVGFLIGETGRERIPCARGRFEYCALAERAFRRDADQLVRHFADALFQAGLFGLPCATAQPVQQTFVVAVFGQQFDVFDRQIQARVFGVFQQKAFARRTRSGDDLHPLIAADTVIDVNYQIIRRQRLNFGQEVFSLTAFLGLADKPVAQHILFGNDCDRLVVIPWAFKAVLQGPDSQMQAPFANARAIGNRNGFGQSFVFDQTGQSFARALGIGCDDDRTTFKLCLNM